jgi:ribosomal protein S18 acetylase RimI-like enzyme
VIRRATLDDAAALAELGARTFHDAFDTHNQIENVDAYVARTYGERQQREEIASPDGATVVAEEEGRLIAFAQLRRVDDAVELARFYVDQRWHGRGVAQSLMAAVYDAARELGSHRLWLGVWEHNARAIAFYAKYGFRGTGSHPFLLGSDLQTDRIMEIGL